MGRVWAAAAGLGLTMGVTAAILALGGLWLGRWVDEQLGSHPIFRLVGAVIGVLTGQVAIYRLAQRAIRDMAPESAGLPKGASVLGPLASAIAIIGLILGPMVVGLVLGTVVDRAAGTSPWLAISGVFFGSIVGLVLCIRRVRRHLSELEDHP